MEKIIKELQPHELYHFAAISSPGKSFSIPLLTYQVNITGTLNLLNAIMLHSKKTKCFFAGSAEMFGNAEELKRNEKTPFIPQSPYGVSKVSGYWATKNYRENFGLFCSAGFLFNHESE